MNKLTSIFVIILSAVNIDELLAQDLFADPASAYVDTLEQHHKTVVVQRYILLQGLKPLVYQTENLHSFIVNKMASHLFWTSFNFDLNSLQFGLRMFEMQDSQEKEIVKPIFKLK